MTKEIINGIDVSECVYFNSVTYEEPYCNIDQERLYACSSDENCYYKQFKRLEQQIEAYQLSENEAKEIIAELEHKNKNLEKESKTYKCQEKFPNQCHCAFRCLGNEFCQDADERINKYKQALEEIRSYCDEQNLKADYTACYITNRIDEVLNDRD